MDDEFKRDDQGRVIIDKPADVPNDPGFLEGLIRISPDGKSKNYMQWMDERKDAKPEPKPEPDYANSHMIHDQMWSLRYKALTARRREKDPNAVIRPDDPAYQWKPTIEQIRKWQNGEDWMESAMPEE